MRGITPFRSLPSLASLFALVLGAAALASMSACSEDDTLGSFEPEPEIDGGNPLPEVDASEEPADGGLDDAAEDAGADADASVLCSPDGLCHLPVPVSDSLRAVWGDGAGTVWVVSDKGDVLRWDGTAFIVHANVPSPLSTIWGSGPTDIWIGGESGIFHGQGATPASVTFTAISYVPTVPVRSIHGFGPNDVWFVGGVSGWEGEAGLVLRYRGPTGDPTNDFQHDPMESEGDAFTTVWGSRPDDMWLAATGIAATPQGARVYHGRGDGNGGTSFERVEVHTGFGSMSLLEVVGAIHVPETFIAGNNWWNQGNVWSGAIHPPDGDAGAVVWGGEEFGSSVRGIYGTSKSDIWLVGDRGRIRHFDGTKWSPSRVTVDKFPFVKNLNAIWGAPNKKEFWIVGDGTVLRKTSGVNP
mgnify:FL=1